MASSADGGEMTMMPMPTMMPMTMTMQMWFTTSSECTILFEKWKTENAFEMLLSCVFFFLLAIVYEALKMARTELACRMKDDKAEMAALNNNRPRKPSISSMFSASHLAQTVLHFLQMTLSYVLMLVVMTYNFWLCLAIVLGFTAGYFMLCWYRAPSVNNEHCG